jgi:hypothetical protein
MVDSWPSFIAKFDGEAERNIRRKTSSGRPVGDDRFLLQLEVLASKALRMNSAGRPRTLK